MNIKHDSEEVFGHAKIVWMLLSLAVTVVILVAGAWASNVNTDIAHAKSNEISAADRLARIETKLDIVLDRLDIVKERVVRKHE